MDKPKDEEMRRDGDAAVEEEQHNYPDEPFPGTADKLEFWHRCPKCEHVATFPKGSDGLHRCSRCSEEFLPLEILGWMQP